MADEPISRVPVISEVSDFLSGGEGWMTPEAAVNILSKPIEVKPQELPKEIPQENQLATMSEDEIIALRSKYPDSHNVQNYLAPFEHRANMRQRVGENLMSALPWSVLVPAYTAVKSVGGVPSNKETSTNYAQEIKQGLIGIGEGIMQHFKTEEKK